MMTMKIVLRTNLGTKEEGSFLLYLSNAKEDRGSLKTKKEGKKWRKFQSKRSLLLLCSTTTPNPTRERGEKFVMNGGRKIAFIIDHLWFLWSGETPLKTENWPNLKRERLDKTKNWPNPKRERLDNVARKGSQTTMIASLEAPFILDKQHLILRKVKSTLNLIVEERANTEREGSQSATKRHTVTFFSINKIKNKIVIFRPRQ